MTHIAGTLGRAGVRVIRFEFPYMAEMRRTGNRKPPNREPTLLERWNLVIDRELAAGTDARRLLIGGKSLGGRMASLIADERGAAALVCLGYPFHPPGKPERTRTAHLARLRTPTLICQGCRDPFGTFEDVSAYDLSPAIEILWLADGNHSLEPRRASGRTAAQNWQEAIDRIAEFSYEL